MGKSFGFERTSWREESIGWVRRVEGPELDPAEFAGGVVQIEPELHRDFHRGVRADLVVELLHNFWRLAAVVQVVPPVHAAHGPQHNNVRQVPHQVLFELGAALLLPEVDVVVELLQHDPKLRLGLPGQVRELQRFPQRLGGRRRQRAAPVVHEHFEDVHAGRVQTEALGAALNQVGVVRDRHETALGKRRRGTPLEGNEDRQLREQNIVGCGRDDLDAALLALAAFAVERREHHLKLDGEVQQIGALRQEQDMLRLVARAFLHFESAIDAYLLKLFNCSFERVNC